MKQCIENTRRKQQQGLYLLILSPRWFSLLMTAKSHFSLHADFRYGQGTTVELGNYRDDLGINRSVVSSSDQTRLTPTFHQKSDCWKALRKSLIEKNAKTPPTFTDCWLTGCVVIPLLPYYCFIMLHSKRSYSSIPNQQDSNSEFTRRSRFSRMSCLTLCDRRV